MGVHGAPLVRDHTGPRVSHLPISLATKLPHPFDNQLQTRGAAFRQQPACGVDG